MVDERIEGDTERIEAHTQRASDKNEWVRKKQNLKHYSEQVLQRGERPQIENRKIKVHTTQCQSAQ